MKKRTRLTSRFTGIIHRENDLFVALCPELDVASQGKSVEEAKGNLRAAVELFLECASNKELASRCRAMGNLSPAFTPKGLQIKAQGRAAHPG